MLRWADERRGHCIHQTCGSVPVALCTTLPRRTDWETIMATNSKIDLGDPEAFSVEDFLALADEEETAQRQ